MRTHKAIMQLLQEAQTERRCAYSRIPSEQSALQRRAQTGELVNTYRGSPSLYSDSSYWNQLTPPEQTLHIAKGLAHAHPDWIFSGLTAATAYGFEHQWCLHNGSVSIATRHHGTQRLHQGLKRVYMPKAFAHTRRDSATGLLLVSPAHALIECAHEYDFRFALPFFDSALARGVTVEEIIEAYGKSHHNIVPVFHLLQQANPRSENGGESLMRGTIYEDQFVMPRIQVSVKDPKTSSEYRVDFVWRLNNGRVVVAEYDGTQKYIDPSMTGNRSIQEMIVKERERDDGLRRAGATEILHVTYPEVIDRVPLHLKLLKAGIPQRADTSTGMS
ncbi:hypothetical protein [Bifidobacterium scaligerum]|uniref:CTP synthase n=1 Tax=Bifidobacterium scaligerum TaxID=2052656 RepID=A0A2M9HS49_9BIFI|nr:hypothetical protein [Bifidobacterium scaligerum]PJM79640.1 hypothetical protein CUU80_00310 [Bifidobacterium scaligerum]